MNDCDHNESDRTEILQENIGNNSYVMRYGCVIKNQSDLETLNETTILYIK